MTTQCTGMGSQREFLQLNIMHCIVAVHVNSDTADAIFMEIGEFGRCYCFGIDYSYAACC
jgi:hypothetical protein